MNLPADDGILLSLVNMKLRDGYSSLTELCEEEGIDELAVISRLRTYGYAYSPEQNAFKPA